MSDSTRVISSAVSSPSASWAGRASWPLFLLSAVSFAVFAGVTLYAKPEAATLGAKEIGVPAAIVIGMAVWFLAARWALGSMARDVHRLIVAVSFAPMLCTLFISLSTLTSEAFAREYWIDRSLKVELLFGLPILALAIQLGTLIWLRLHLSWRVAGPAVSVLAIGFVLRYAGMGWGLPFAYQPEETSIYIRWANEFAIHEQLNPHYFQNPSLLIYLLGFQFHALYAICRVLQFGQDAGDLYMVFRGEQDLFFAMSRMNSVLLGTATVLLVYLLGRKLLGQRAGLVAGLLLAVNFLHVRNSQYAVNDVPSTFFLVFAFFFAVRIYEKGQWRDYLLAGLMAGLAASTKYNAGMVVVAIAVAHWLRGSNLISRVAPGPMAKLVVAAGWSLAGFVVGTPYSVLSFPEFRDGFLEQLGMGQASWSGQSSAQSGWLFLNGVAHGAGWIACGLALIGAVYLVARNRRPAWLLLSFPLCYFFFMSIMDLFFVRWVVPVMPFVALLSAAGVEWLCARFSGRTRQRAVVVLVALAMLQPTIFSLRLDWLVHQQDTREEANLWAELNIPAGSQVAIEAFSILDQEALTFRPTLQNIKLELDWRITMHPMEYYRQNGFNYIAISSWLYDRAYTDPAHYADRIAFYEQLDREAQLMATFAPRKDGGNPPFALDDLDTPFWNLFYYDRPGPTIKVYKLGS